MARRFNVGVDVDGVLADFTGGARKLLKQLYGKPDDSLVQTTWAFESLGITAKQERHFWQIVDIIPNWWESLERNPATLSLIELAKEHRVIFITNRKDGTGRPVEEQTQRWLSKNFGIEWPNVVLSGAKGPTAVGLKLDFFIDDRPKNVREVFDSAPDCNTYMLSTTYNQPDGACFSNVNTFDEFAKIIFKEAKNAA